MELAKSSADVAAFTKAFADYLESDWHLSSRVEEAAKEQEAAGLIDEAQRMVQSYEKAMEILGQVNEIMGDAPVVLSEFTDIYVSGLSLDVEVRSDPADDRRTFHGHHDKDPPKADESRGGARRK